MKRKLKIEAHATCWAVVISTRDWQGINSYWEDQASADAALAELPLPGFVLPPKDAWAGKESA